MEKVEKTERKENAGDVASKVKSVRKTSRSSGSRSVSKSSIKKNEKEVPVIKKTVIVKYPKFVWRFLLFFVFIVMLAGIIFLGAKKFTAVKKDSRVAMVDKQLSFCSELVSGKYRYSDVIALKKKSGLARSYSIVKYSGIIRAGLEDIGDIVYEVDENHNSIVLKVPPAELLGNEICSQEVFDEKQSIFVPITAKEIFLEIEEAKEEAVAGIVADGLLEESWDQACNVIRQFMYSCGFDEVRLEELH